MKDKYEERCHDCAYLIEGNDGEWLCSNCALESEITDIHSIEYCEAFNFEF